MTTALKEIHLENEKRDANVKFVSLIRKVTQN